VFGQGARYVQLMHIMDWPLAGPDSPSAPPAFMSRGVFGRQGVAPRADYTLVSHCFEKCRVRPSPDPAGRIRRAGSPSPPGGARLWFKRMDPYRIGTSLRQIQNASTPLATITKAMNEGHGCARKAFTINQTDTTRKSHSVKG
jgi:hypothetical protein